MFCYFGWHDWCRVRDELDHFKKREVPNQNPILGRRGFKDTEYYCFCVRCDTERWVNQRSLDY